MSQRALPPDCIAELVKAHLEEKMRRLAPQGDWSAAAARFGWCGEVLDYLAEGLEEHVRDRGFTFHMAYPGPLRLWDEDRHPDGEHVRRFWAVAYDAANGRPLARVCTLFFHRHDRVALPRPPLVMGFPIGTPADEESPA